MAPIYFQVMIQPHNRRLSFSLYICALSVVDTMVLLTGELKLYIFSDNYSKDISVNI